MNWHDYIWVSDNWHAQGHSQSFLALRCVQWTYEREHFLKTTMVLIAKLIETQNVEKKKWFGFFGYTIKKNNSLVFQIVVYFLICFIVFVCVLAKITTTLSRFTLKKCMSNLWLDKSCLLSFQFIKITSKQGKLKLNFINTIRKIPVLAMVCIRYWHSLTSGHSTVCLWAMCVCVCVCVCAVQSGCVRLNQGVKQGLD